MRSLLRSSTRLRNTSAQLRNFASNPTPAAGTAKNPLKYFSAWFCPFAHRATIALEYHRSAVHYDWEESLGWEQRAPTGEEEFDAKEREDWWYHWKSPALLAANPLGMVPTLLDEPTNRAVTESLVVIQFIDELAARNGSNAPSLLSSDPFESAAARVAAEHVNKHVTSGYYQALVRTEESERAAGFERILEGLRVFTSTSRGALGAAIRWASSTACSCRTLTGCTYSSTTAG